MLINIYRNISLIINTIVMYWGLGIGDWGLGIGGLGGGPQPPTPTPQTPPPNPTKKRINFL